MAYLRDEKESFEVDYAAEKIWALIPEVVKILEWSIEETDEKNYKVKLKSKTGFFSYSTILNVEVTAISEKVSKMVINAETPVTTITSIADFGRTRDRLGQFVDTLAKELEKRKP